jgi:hypothetical protein
MALALGEGGPESLAFAARALALPLDARAARAPDPALLAATLRRVAGAALAPTRANPFADWALVPAPG